MMGWFNRDPEGSAGRDALRLPFGSRLNVDYPRIPVTASPFTSSRGWFRWL